MAGERKANGMVWVILGSMLRTHKNRLRSGIQTRRLCSTRAN